MSRTGWVYLLLPVALLILGVISLFSGATGLGELVQNRDFVLWDYRMPRILIALLAGAGLGLAGALIQGVIRNPLAAPDIIGITQGAGLAATAMLVVWPDLPFIWLIPGGAAGGLLAALLVWKLAWRHRAEPARLALIGIAMGAWLAAVTDWLLVSHPLEINAALVWLTGSLWGRGWEHVWLLLPVLLLLIPLALQLAYRLNLLALGDEAAEGLGAGVLRTRQLTLLVAVLLSAVSVAVCGTLSFVGLVAPHLARLLVGEDHRRLLVVAAGIGALLVLLADMLARTVAPPLELPAGVLTALIGAPYFLFLLTRYKGW